MIESCTLLIKPDYPAVQADTASLLPSADLFDKAVVSAGFYLPSKEVYEGFKKSFHAAGFRSEREVAIFLAQILHESGGLKYVREINPPASAYDRNTKASSAHMNAAKCTSGAPTW